MGSGTNASTGDGEGVGDVLECGIESSGDGSASGWSGGDEGACDVGGIGEIEIGKGDVTGVGDMSAGVVECGSGCCGGAVGGVVS